MWTVAWPHSVPPWVSVSSEALSDLYWLAVRARQEVPSSDRAAAITATVSWLHGGQDAPITGRPAGMVSSSAAEAELWAARRVTEPEAVDLEWITARWVCATSGRTRYR